MKKREARKLRARPRLRGRAKVKGPEPRASAWRARRAASTMEIAGRALDHGLGVGRVFVSEDVARDTFVVRMSKRRAKAGSARSVDVGRGPKTHRMTVGESSKVGGSFGRRKRRHGRQ